MPDTTNTSTTQSAARDIRGATPLGPDGVLGLAYGFFTLAAGARSSVQLATQASRAPLAYALSAVAAVIYLAGAIVILRAHRGARDRRIAMLLCRLELAGVALVGSASLLLPSAFPDATVWSHYGSGYGFVPAVLPLLALCWLHRPQTNDGPDH